MKDQEIKDILDQEDEIQEEINRFNLREAVIYSAILEQKHDS